MEDHDVPRYGDCHHFQVVMTEACPWCLKSKLEAAELQKDETHQLMNALYSFLSLVRHRHIPAGIGLEAQIDPILGRAFTALEPWWKKQLYKTEKPKGDCACGAMGTGEPCKPGCHVHVFINYQCERCGKGQETEKRIPDMPKLDGPEPTLSPEDQAALDAIKCKRCGLHGLRCVFCTPASSSTCGH